MSTRANTNWKQGKDDLGARQDMERVATAEERRAGFHHIATTSRYGYENADHGTPKIETYQPTLLRSSELDACASFLRIGRPPRFRQVRHIAARDHFIVQVHHLKNIK